MRKREDPVRDIAFEKFVRDGFVCVANNKDCRGVLEFAHLEHSGMGGRAVPSYGNGVCMCQMHHTSSYCKAYHRIGRQNFEETNHINLAEIAAYLARAFDGDFITLAEDPPAGVYQKAG